MAIYLDLAALSVDAATINGKPLPSSAWRDSQLELPQVQEANTLEVTAAVSTADPLGLVSFTDVNGERFVYTYGRTDGAPRWTPCFLDVPADWDLRVTVPEDWTVLSHCPATRTSSGAWRFLPPYPLPDGPTFVAGPLARIDGPAGVPMWSRPSLTGLVEQSPIGDMVATAIAHHEQVLDVRYPYETRDCIFIPDYGSQAGCSGGLILLHEQALHASLSEEWRRYAQWVIAHETAHSWFGDLVGFDGDEHRWTAEGLATYLCHRANNSWPRFHLLEELEVHRDDLAGNDAPSLIYAKPAAIVRHLESIIGTSAVEAGMTAWLQRNAGGSSTGTDLITEWAAAAEDDLEDWARDWLLTPGVNTLAFDRATSTIHQSGSPLRTHHLTMQLLDDDATPLDEVDLIVTGETTAVTSPTAAQAPIVVLNAPARTYARTRLDEQTVAALPACLGSLPKDARAATWVSLLEMADEGLIPATMLGTLIGAHAANEPDPQVRDLLTAAIPAK